MYEHKTLYIGGRWEPPTGTDIIEVVSPHSEEVIGRVPDPTTADIDRAVAAARTAFDQGPWPRFSPEERAAVLSRLHSLYAARQGELAELISAEMGCPITLS